MKNQEIVEKTENKLAKLEMAEEAGEDGMKWGLPLNEIYKLSTKFYKGFFCSDLCFSVFFYCCNYEFLQINREKLCT